MKIIIPMAGRGSRIRPHSLTVPKPLIPVAGKPIVQHLVEDLAAMAGEALEEVAFIIGDFGTAVEKELLAIASSLGAKGSIYHQDQPLGTAHAIQCAHPSLSGNCIVAFADTLFTADFNIDTDADGMIYVKKIEDPRQFGVVKIGDGGYITEFQEKPEVPESDLAIIGIYYFKDGKNLSNELQYLIDNNITEKGEFQLTNALENMKQKGLQLYPGTVDGWFDCGNKQAALDTNQKVLDIKAKHKYLKAGNFTSTNSVIVEPCFIGDGVVLKNAVVGPYVSIGANSVIENTVISNSMVQLDSKVINKVISNTMIGNHALVEGIPSDLSVGDFTEMKD